MKAKLRAERGEKIYYTDMFLEGGGAAGCNSAPPGAAPDQNTAELSPADARLVRRLADLLRAGDQRKVADVIRRIIDIAAK